MRRAGSIEQSKQTASHLKRTVLERTVVPEKLSTLACKAIRAWAIATTKPATGIRLAGMRAASQPLTWRSCAHMPSTT